MQPGKTTQENDFSSDLLRYMLRTLYTNNDSVMAMRNRTRGTG